MQMKFRKGRIFNHLFIVLALSMLASCSLDKDDNSGYEDWKELNDRYLSEFDQNYAEGANPYTKVSPDWAPQNSVYIRWHNDRVSTADKLQPLSNSTVDITYEMEDIDGTKLGNSFSMTANGDSIYRCKPNSNIVGMWAALVNMHEGDTVTMMIPYPSGYGDRKIGSIRPYTNLIYHVKLKKVVKYEMP